MVWRRDVFLERLLQDEALAKEILRDYLTDVKERIALLKLLIEAGDMIGARDIAHTIKGAAASVSAAERMSLAARKIERGAEAGENSMLLSLLSKLEACLEEFREVLECEEGPH